MSTLLALIAAGPASAQSAWWQLSSGVAPTIVQPGTATDELQEVTAEPGMAFELKVGSTTVGVFESAPYPFSAFTHATAENVQSALESTYGAGDVLVSGGPAGSAPLQIRSTGQDADRSVAPVEVGLQLAGVATANVATQGRGDGKLILMALNLGDAPASGANVPIDLSDKLPDGLRATAVSAVAGFNDERGPVSCALAPSAHEAHCQLTGALQPYEEIEASIEVVVEGGAASGSENELRIEGGQMPGAAVRRPVSIGDTSTPFGIEDYEMRLEEEGGLPDTQAGSHPFQWTTTLVLNQTANRLQPPALPKDLSFDLPPGLVGDPIPFPQCSDADFAAHNEHLANLCPADTALGVAAVSIDLNGSLDTVSVPVFNLKPAPGEPVRLGFDTLEVPVTIDTSVRTGSDYGVVAHVTNVTQTAAFLSSRVTIWGVPGDPRHDASRGWNCVAGGIFASAGCVPQDESHAPPFVTLPTGCSGAPLATSLQADSWKEPENVISGEPAEPLQTLEGCNRLDFNPSIEIAPDGQAASTPTGLTVHVHVPQETTLDAEGLAESDVKETTVTLPEGVQLSPSGGNGLQACSDAQIGFTGVDPSTGTDEFTPNPPSCPNASKVGTVKIKTPLLANLLEGSVFLAAPQNVPTGPLENPFRALVAMYIVAEEPVSGVLLKLPGEVTPSVATGQLVSTFANTPPLPFEDLEVHFFGGGRAPLSTPPLCGGYSTRASIAPWSGNAAVEPVSTFEITSGPGGAPCADPQPFVPGFNAQATNVQAGAFTPFTTTITRPDADQTLGGIALHMPPGLSGMLPSVKLCEEPQAAAGTCSPESLIGSTTVSAGLGGDPYTVEGGKVFITGPTAGAPFGLSIVNPAVAGPFNLGTVVVRAKIEIDPRTAALTVSTVGPLPTMLQGIPLQLQHINVTIGRPGFTFNPTDCEKLSLTGTISSSAGASASVASAFQVTDCAALAFKPTFSASTSGHTSRPDGASLSVKLAFSHSGPQSADQGGEANIARVHVELPKSLPARLTTLQKACTEKQFASNPARCPVGSVVGHAKAITPILPVPLEGPAYFVSHGGASFPELILVLQGDGVTIQLNGETYIDPKTDITSSTFAQVPDAPVNSFELTLPQGQYSALTANGSLCQQKLVMLTAFVAQNGATLNQETHVEVEGCSSMLSVVSSAVHGKALSLKIFVPSAGKLHVSGKGLSSSAKTAYGRETLTVVVHEKRGKHLHTKVSLKFAPSKGKELSKSVSVRFKK